MPSPDKARHLNKSAGRAKMPLTRRRLEPSQLSSVVCVSTRHHHVTPNLNVDPTSAGVDM
eukprot:9746799-Alexandrium_andersonii.AAC.1